MLSGCILLKLPKDWQDKMHSEILSKVKLCISDVETAAIVSDFIWKLLCETDLNKQELSLRLKDHLNEHSLAFSEWVIDFSQKSIEYFIESNLANVTDDRITEPVSQSDDKSTDKLFGETTKIDPLDDTLDNLIRKEKIAKLEGLTNVPLGVQTKSGKFKAPHEKGYQNTPTKPTFYKNLTLNDPTREVLKVPKICMNFPNCAFGDSCRYVHPVHKLCKNYPNCSFGEKCAFIHPKE